MSDRIFTSKDWKRIKRDVFDDFFNQNDMSYDMKELMKAQLLGTQEVPEGSHIMPGGEMMADSGMEGVY